MDTFENTAQADRLNAQSNDLCPVCHQTVWLSFYFDAFGHNKDEDGPRISNIGKLFMAAMKKPPKGIFSFYYPGLGATFHPELALLAAMEAKKIAEDAKQAEEDIAKKAGTSTATKVGKEAWQHKEGWWQRVERTLKKDGKKLLNNYKEQSDIVFKPSERARYLRGVGRYWKNFVDDLFHHPGRLLKTVENELAKVTVGHVAERWGFARDAAWVSALFNTGVDTRMQAAIDDFKEAVKTTGKIGKIHHINVAIFGADMGGALAVAFANKLLKEVCKDGKYKAADNAEVNIRFMGLFDCVAARYDDNFLTGFVPLANSVAGDLTLPKKVERVVHFAAAHENRLFKHLSSIGGVKQPGARLEERLFPGAQEDVVGGYEPGEQGCDNQLSRLPLRMMLGRAWRYGVPVYSLEQLENDKAVDINIFPWFQMNSSVSDLVYDYWNKVRELSTTVKTVSSLDIKDFQRGHIDTGHTCALLPPPAQIKNVPQDIKGELPAHMALYVSWLKHWYGTHDTFSNDLQRHRHMLLKNEISTMSLAAELNPLDPAAMRAEDRTMWTIWQANDGKLPGKLMPLFEKYIHDSMADCAIEHAWGDFMYSRHYLNYRPINLIEQEPDKNFFDTLLEKFSDAKATYETPEMSGFLSP